MALVQISLRYARLRFVKAVHADLTADENAVFLTRGADIVVESWVNACSSRGTIQL